MKSRISVSLEKRFFKMLSDYANFLCVPRCDMIQLLLRSGLNDFQENPFPIISAQSKNREQLHKYQELFREISKSEEKHMVKQADTIETQMDDLKWNIEDKFVRTTFYISEKQKDMIQHIRQEANKNGGRFLQSDIIYAMMQHSLNKELYTLSYQPFWKMNLYENVHVLKEREITIKIPEIIYFGLRVCKDELGVSLPSYLTAVLYDDFISKKELINAALQRELKKEK